MGGCSQAPVRIIWDTLAVLQAPAVPGIKWGLDMCALMRGLQGQRISVVNKDPGGYRVSFTFVVLGPHLAALGGPCSTGDEQRRPLCFCFWCDLVALGFYTEVSLSGWLASAFAASVFSSTGNLGLPRSASAMHLQQALRPVPFCGRSRASVSWCLSAPPWEVRPVHSDPSCFGGLLPFRSPRAGIVILLS